MDHGAGRQADRSETRCSRYAEEFPCARGALGKQSTTQRREAARRSMTGSAAMKGNRMFLSESLLAEVKSLIAFRLGRGEESIDVGVSVSVKEHDTATGRKVTSYSISESRSWSRSYGTSTSTTTTEDE